MGVLPSGIVISVQFSICSFATTNRRNKSSLSRSFVMTWRISAFGWQDLRSLEENPSLCREASAKIISPSSELKSFRDMGCSKKVRNPLPGTTWIKLPKNLDVKLWAPRSSRKLKEALYSNIGSPEISQIEPSKLLYPLTCFDIAAWNNPVDLRSHDECLNPRLS